MAMPLLIDSPQFQNIGVSSAFGISNYKDVKFRILSIDFFRINSFAVMNIL